MKRLMALMTLTVLTACDSADRADFRNERADALYQSAMDDYRAGRLDAAVKGFTKVLLKDPGNASARFQLACLQQDSRQDFVEAYCGYREYLRQYPKSDKAPLAQERLEKCEAELAKRLAEKHGLLKVDGYVRELESVRASLKSAETRAAQAEKEVESLRQRVSALTGERNRLLGVLKGTEADGDVSDGRKLVKEAKDLLEEEDETDRVKMSADAAALKSEEADEISAGSSLLPVATNARPVVAEVENPEAKKKSAQPSHPETYEVQEGDTLYGIAKRFYGRKSEWKRIRDANKALIPMDNRLRAGDVITLP